MRNLDRPWRRWTADATATMMVVSLAGVPSRAEARAIQNQNHHMDNNGWSDTDQDFSISRGGHIVEGRPHEVVAPGGRQRICHQRALPVADTTGVGIVNTSGGFRGLGAFSFRAGACDIVAVSGWTSGASCVVADAVMVTRV